MSRRSRGSAVLECVIALAVITIVVSAAMDGVKAQARGSLLAKDALRVRLSASSRLESAPTRPLEAGRRAFDPAAPGLTGEEEVREVAPGLYEVSVRVKAASGARAELVTRVATEGRRP